MGNENEPASIAAWRVESRMQNMDVDVRVWSVLGPASKILHAMPISKLQMLTCLFSAVGRRYRTINLVLDRCCRAE